MDKNSGAPPWRDMGQWTEFPCLEMCRDLWIKTPVPLLLRSRPTCHGIRRTVIDIARESLVFFFFRIILRLDPCRTGLLQLLDLIHVTSPYRTHASNPITRTASWTASFLVISIPVPLDVIMTYDSDPDSDPILSYD